MIANRIASIVLQTDKVKGDSLKATCEALKSVTKWKSGNVVFCIGINHTTETRIGLRCKACGRRLLNHFLGFGTAWDYDIDEDPLKRYNTVQAKMMVAFGEYLDGVCARTSH